MRAADGVIGQGDTAPLTGTYRPATLVDCSKLPNGQVKIIFSPAVCRVTVTGVTCVII